MMNTKPPCSSHQLETDIYWVPETRTPEHRVERTPWGNQFCRVSLCALMSLNQHRLCCAAYKQCCAYLEIHARPDPFSLVKPDKLALSPLVVTIKPKRNSAGSPTSMRLRELVKPPSLSLTRHHHTTPLPRPAVYLLGGGEDLLKTSYNDQLVKNHERLCVHSYCGLMTPSQHKLCCNVYDQCCAYSNYLLYYGEGPSGWQDPFHPDNGRRRR
ncbi:hypothetical protein GWK47_035771 [Chionoecetes opilio]|uniref:Uncharacterized protein n=1 Tax=Chionoecetes opilio TaxID=41210 RepID=A0A8J4YTU7_CHIOP|nr:hypothetical protein GWK47_035771 [Chionoecetes opilio]